MVKKFHSTAQYIVDTKKLILLKIENIRIDKIIYTKIITTSYKRAILKTIRDKLKSVAKLAGMIEIDYDIKVVLHQTICNVIRKVIIA